MFVQAFSTWQASLPRVTNRQMHKNISPKFGDGQIWEVTFNDGREITSKTRMVGDVARDEFRKIDKTLNRPHQLTASSRLVQLPFQDYGKVTFMYVTNDPSVLGQKSDAIKNIFEKRVKNCDLVGVKEVELKDSWQNGASLFSAFDINAEIKTLENASEIVPEELLALKKKFVTQPESIAVADGSRALPKYIIETDGKVSLVGEFRILAHQPFRSSRARTVPAVGGIL